MCDYFDFFCLLAKYEKFDDTTMVKPVYRRTDNTINNRKDDDGDTNNGLQNITQEIKA